MNLAYSVEEGYRELIDRAERHIRSKIAIGEIAPPSWMYEWITDLEQIRARELAEPIREVEAVRLIHAQEVR